MTNPDLYDRTRGKHATGSAMADTIGSDVVAVDQDQLSFGSGLVDFVSRSPRQESKEDHGLRFTPGLSRKTTICQPR